MLPYNVSGQTMKMNTLARKICLHTLLAIGVLFASSSAHACHKYDYACKAKDRATKTANDAQHAADAAAQQARDAANKAAADAKAAADKAAAAAQALAAQLAKDGAAISQAEMTSMLKTAKSAYADTDQAVNGGLKVAVDGLQKLINQALEALWRAAGKSQASQASKQLLDMKHRALALDAEGQAALNRVRRAIASKDLDEQARSDMNVLVKAIVFGGNDIGNSVKNSSFGIQICDSAGGGNVGGEVCYMMIMQTFLQDGKFKVGLARSIGVAATPVPSDVGAAVTYGIFWGPGGISDNDGASIGMALGVVAEEGLEAGVSWGVPVSTPDPSALVPGIGISIGGGAKGEAALTAGYTMVIAVM